MTVHDSVYPVFVYGTLTDPARVDALVDDWEDTGEAILEGLERVDGRYPTLAPGGRTSGRLLLTPELDRLDEYEAVDRELYLRVAVPVVDGDRAWLYVGAPEALDAPVSWPGTGSFADRVDAVLAARSVRVIPADNR
jgi:gamma-glutamylcyclotransferase (GGCT)/AIG2-like uncharacterized protein YtfP